MDDDPPDPFSPDATLHLPGDVVTPRTASARRALRDHELVLRAHESGTGEYRKMLVDAEQGMEKLLEMNRALRKELELERRAGGSAGGIGTHSNGTQTAVLAATLEDTRARLRETEVQLDTGDGIVRGAQAGASGRDDRAPVQRVGAQSVGRRAASTGKRAE